MLSLTVLVSILSIIFCAFIYLLLELYIVAMMTFNQSVYMIGESDGEVHLEINLSNKTSRSIGLTVEVLSDGTNATGRYCVCLKCIVIV